MQLSGNTILITGGSEGIGLAIARSLAPENRVILCGRSEEKLQHAQLELPDVHTEVCDITDAAQRSAMLARVSDAYPDLNMLVNNAGARMLVNLLENDGVEAAMAHDMALNFEAPAALCTALLPQLRSRPRAAIVNMTTGLVYLPKARQAFYCAAKAALHSYTQSLRWVLDGSTVEVFEVFLTLVNTNFHQGRLPTNIPAIGADEAARVTVRGLRRGKRRIHVGKAALARWLSLLAPGRGMAIVNR